MPRYFRVLHSLTRRLLNRHGEAQSAPSADRTTTNCPQKELAWVGPLSKAHRQPWYLLLNPNGVAIPAFLEQASRVQPHHAEEADRSFHAWIAEQALIIDRLAQLGSEVNLYKALGGGWQEQEAPANTPVNTAPAG